MRPPHNWWVYFELSWKATNMRHLPTRTRRMHTHTDVHINRDARTVTTTTTQRQKHIKQQHTRTQMIKFKETKKHVGLFQNELDPGLVSWFALCIQRGPPISERTPFRDGFEGRKVGNLESPIPIFTLTDTRLEFSGSNSDFVKDPSRFPFDPRET